MEIVMSRICFVIENLGSGGAQKQLYLLCKELSKLENSLTVYCFHTYGKDFYTKKLRALGVKVEHKKKTSYLNRIIQYERFISNERPDHVISLLYGANLLVTLVKIFHFGSYQIIVSDRTGIVGGITKKDQLRYQLYRFAKYVVTNSTHTAETIKIRAPWLSRKVKVIWNLVPSLEGDSRATAKKTFLIGARYHPLKNHENLLKAFLLALEVSPKKEMFQLKCFGSKFGEKNSAVFDKLSRIVHDSEYSQNIDLLDETQLMDQEILNADFCVLPSFYEGCPNFIIEGMSASKVILMSNVCSNADILPAGGGFLFDPNDIEEMKLMILKAMGLSISEVIEMGERNKQRAFDLFNPQSKAKEYLELMNIRNA
jgi:glycosyltransferase involved in cell wall biosynthesis